MCVGSVTTDVSDEELRKSLVRLDQSGVFLHDPSHFHIFQQHAHRFLYTDFVQNRLDEWDVQTVRALSPDTAFVHGKHSKAFG